ncbi:MAG: sugar phosphate isomerase/epimerase family protein [Candidatus Omnitrophota bacterium]
MQLSLCTWSYHRTLEAGKLDFDGLVELAAKELKLNGIDIIADHLPKTDKKYLFDLKKKCADLTLTVACLSPGNNFGQPDEKSLTNEVDTIKKWIDCACMLGTPVVRIFAGWAPKEQQAKLWPNVVKGIKQSAEHAKDTGVTLAIEYHNGGGFLPTSKETFRLLEEVNSPYVQLNVDTGNYHDADNYAAVAKSMPFARHLHLKFHNIAKDGAPEEFDYDKIFKIFKESDYRGFYSVEYEGAGEETEYVPKAFAFAREYGKKYDIL